jgi:hypothetical protein
LAAVFGAAVKLVPRGAQRGAKAWWSDEAKADLRKARTAKANWTRDPLEGNREQWQTLQRKATKTVLEEKATSFEGFLDRMDLRKDPGAPFRLLKAMETPSRNPRDAPLSKIGGNAVTIKAKADRAISHYASINMVMRNKTADNEIREVARPLRNYPPDCSFCINFSRTELKTALRRQSGKAAGPDGITPWMLQ